MIVVEDNEEENKKSSSEEAIHQTLYSEIVWVVYKLLW